MNNFERLRQMSIDEMVNILDRDNSCECCVYFNIECGDNPGITCSEGIKKWLSAEVGMSDKEFYTRLRNFLKDHTSVLVKEGAMRELNQLETEINKRLEESEGK